MIKINESQSANEKRLILENLMNCYFDYKYHMRSHLWYRDGVSSSLLRLMQSKEVVETAKLIIALFEVAFTEEHKYQSNGVLIISKILQPILYLSKKTSLCNYIYQLDRKFLIDTQINPFQNFQIKNEKIDLSTKIFIKKISKN